MNNSCKRMACLSLLCLGATMPRLNAAVYQETGGVVVVEAEHFDSRVADPGNPDHTWKIIPDEDPGTGDAPSANARGGKYIESLPDAGINNNADNTFVGIPPYVDYKVSISTLGKYRLWLRFAGWDGGSDSMYAQVLELRKSNGGTGAEFYRYIGQVNDPNDTTIVDFSLIKNTSTGGSAIGWNGDGGYEALSAGGGEVEADYDIPSPGVYTIRLSQREDGSQVDAILFQLANLPQPTNPGPAESGAATSYINFAKQPLNANVPPGATATFTVNANGSGTASYQWQKAAAGSTTFTDIAGATGTNYTTAAVTTADSGTQFRVKVTVPGLTLNSLAATLTVDVTPPSIASIRALTPTTMNVIFSEPIQASGASNKANFGINNGITISNVTIINPTTVQLTTSGQSNGAPYTLTINNIKDIIGNTVPANTTQNFSSVTFGTGLILHRFFNNFTSGTPTDLLKDPRYPDNPTLLTLEPFFEYPPNAGNGVADNYGNEMSGWLVPPTTGDYVFFLASDDHSVLFLSTDESPVNKKLIAQETLWSNSRQWTSSGGPSDLPSKRSDQFPGTEWPTKNADGGAQITLTAGKRYYIQALHQEGGGGDDVGVAWSLPGAGDPADGDPPIDGQYVGQYVGAGEFPDFTLNSAIGSPDFTHATLAFSFNLDASVATNILNYTITGLTVSNVTVSPDGKSVTLATAKQTGGTSYTVTVKNLVDSFGRPLVGNATATFAGFVLAKGGVIQKYWDNITPNTTDTLRNDPRFPDNPTFITIEPRFEFPPNGASTYADTYGNTLSGWFIPPTTGDYVFFTCSDDPSDLFLSTDDNAANKKLIAQETAWSNPRQWINSGGGSDLAQKRSDQFASSEWPTPNKITLTAGKQYYIEVQHTEGGGGDNVGVTFIKAGDPDPTDGTLPIDGSFIQNYLPPASVTITQQPVNITVVQNTSAAFTVGVNSASTITYQWQKAAPGGTFADVPGAIGATYTIPLTPLSENGNRYRVVVTGVGSSATSGEAVLNVTPDTTAPTLVSAVRSYSDPNSVIVKFSEPLGTSATTAANFKLNGTAATGATLSSDLLTVTLSSASAVPTNATLTVTGVADLAGNSVAANTSATLTLQKAIYFVTADPGPLTFAGDQAVQAHLLARGFEVVLAQGSAVPDDGSTAAGTDLIIESSSLGSGTVEVADPNDTTGTAPPVSKFKTLAIPAIDWEASSQDAWGFRPDNGITSTESQITILDSTSPLAAGFPAGPLTVVTSPQTISEGLVPTGAHLVASAASAPTEYCLYYYDKGDKGYNNFVMPERRVFFFLQDNTAAALNDAGWKLFDTAVDWAMHVQSTVPPAQPKLSISQSGNALSISWTSTGTLQSTTSLTSPISWKDESNTSPFTATISGNAKFYRVKQ